ncbi:MAG: MFS transporter [Balneolaceae bacterium]|nr:MFS transporter [Balneolaceae bacterium]
MKVEGHQIWITLFLAVFIVSGYLYYTVHTNQIQLQEQSIRSFSLAKNNLMSSWENYKVQCQSDTTLTRSISKDADLKQVLNFLLDQMPPGDFFDLTIIADSSGKIMIAEPDIPVAKMPVDDSTTADEIKLGILQSNMNISTEDYQVYQAPLTLEWETDDCITEENEDENSINSQNEEGVSSESRQIILYTALSQDALNQVRWHIPFLTVYVLLSLVILIVVSYPIIRILGMGRGDNFTGAHVYQTGLSIILLSLFIGFSISYFSSRTEIIKNQKNAVQSLSDKIEQFHNEQINYYSDLLTDFMKYGADAVHTEDFPFKELISIGRDGRILDIWLYGESAAEPDSFIQTLPNLAERHYFRRADTESFYHGSHFSYSDGNFEGVISKKVSHRENLADDDVYIQAITFSFDDFDRADSTHVTRTIFESINCLDIQSGIESIQLNKIGLKYLIINRNGEVYYQSPSVKTATSTVHDVVNPAQWNELQALMANNPETSQPLDLRLSFEGHSFNASLQKLAAENPAMKEESWLLVFDDPNLIAFRSYSVFMYSTIGYFVILIVFFVIGLIFYLLRPKRLYLSFRRFNDYLFRPSFKKRKEYVILTLIIFTHILFFCIIFLMDLHHFWLFIPLFGLTITFIALTRHMLLSGFLKNQRSFSDWKLPLALGTFSLLITSLLFLMIFFGITYTWLTIALIIIQLAWLWFLFSSKGIFSFSFVKNKSGSVINQLRAFIRKPKELYAFVFAFWALLIGMMAGYAIHHSAFHFEDKLWEIAVEHTTEEVQAHSSSDGLQFLHRNRKHKFLDHLEYWRRQWLFNYSGVDYPVMDRYIYAGRGQIFDAFDHDGHTHENIDGHDHEKDFLDRTVIILSFFGGFFLLYLIIKNLSQRIFLTEYHDFISEDNPDPKVENHTYILTLDHKKTMVYLKDGFLKNRKYHLLDLSAQSDREKIKLFESRDSVDGLLNDTDGLVLLNADRALISPDTMHKLTDLIAASIRSNKFLILTGSKSMKELSEIISEKKDQDLEKALSNWLDVISSFFTTIIPINHGLKIPSETLQSSKNKLINKLKTETQFGPHTEKLTDLLEQIINRTGTERFTKKEYEAFILRVQRHNKTFYQNIWDQLTFREKRMVHNFAREGFINYSNIDVLTELLQKGIFRADKESEEMRLFNLSFCNFATQSVTQELARLFNKDRKQNGNVSHMRNALLTIIFLTILAISLFAPDLPERYIGAISGGLALISSLASVAGKLSLNLPFFEK